MPERPDATRDGASINRSRLFFGVCLALIPTGASFALVSNILVPLKQQFILTNYQVGLIGGAALWGMALSLLIAGPMLEGFGLKNGARLAFLGHLTGISLMIFAVTRVGDPSAFWFLMVGAATLAAGNGMIEVTGNPLVAALYPDEKTKRLNWFHAFFPIGIVGGGIAGFLLANYGGSFGHWTWQLALIYVPILVYGVMVLPQRFPRTENAEVGIPVGEMFRYTLTNPFFLLMLVMMAITTSMELGPMRWVPAVLEAGGLHGILVLVWISGWMAVLRFFAGHAIEKLSPPGMLLGAALLTGSGLFLLSFSEGLWSAFAAATVFAWGVAFFFPTMVGTVSERMPRTGSLGIVLTAGIGLGMSGLVGVPAMGKLADRYLAEEIPVETADLLTRVQQAFPAHVARAATADATSLGFRVAEVEGALAATQTAMDELARTGSVQNDATANALRAIVATRIPGEPLVGEAAAVLMPAEATGGQRSFRFVAPLALILIGVFGVIYLNDRRRGGYRAVKLAKALVLFVGFGALGACASSGAPGGAAPAAQRADAMRPVNGRLRVLFLGDNGHHRPTARAKELLPVLAARGIDLFYTDDPADLNDQELNRYHAVMLYNNHTTVAPSQMSALQSFVGDGGGLVVLHCASASFQNSEAFIRLVGAAFKSHGTGTFSTVRVAGEHAAIAGVPTFESWDETYVHTKHNPVDRTVLEVRRENGHDEPWTWVRSYGSGRVFYTAWGHDQRTWGNKGFQQLVERGTRWASGDWALGIVATGPALTTKELEVPLPTYRRDTVWNVLGEPVTQAQVPLPTLESLETMTLKPKFSVTPFAMEPMIGNIIDFTWDERGRMWAVETQDYPNTVLPDSVPGNDRVLILEDANADGLADKVTVFASGLNLATSIALANGGAVVGQAPHMFFFKDTDGDDKADEKRILSTGWPRNDTHGAISNLRYGFDNQVWGSVGYNGYRGTVGRRTYNRGDFTAGYYRFPVDGSELEYMARTSNNTWGVALSEDGFVFGSTANSRPSNFVAIPVRYWQALGIRDTVLPDIADRLDVFPVTEILQVDQFGRYTAGTAHEIYTARAFPKEYWNRAAFVAEPTAHLIGMFDLQHNGSNFRAKNRWSFMAARDQWMAPVQVKVGPDGAIWVSDFYTLVAQHNPTPRNMKGCCQTGAGAAYETPNRDRLHGRIYRIAYDSAAKVAPMRLDRANTAQLVAALANDNMFWRMTAQRLLVERKATDAIPALIKLVDTHTVDAQGLNSPALHALWTLHGLGAITSNAGADAAARRALHHPAGGVRRAALQMLPRDARLADGIFGAGLLPDRGSPTAVDYTVGSSVLQDADAHVRLEALLVLSELPASARNAAAATEVILTPENARDPWMPDAAAMAGAKQGPAFLTELLARRMPTDSLTLAGVRRSVQKLARHHAIPMDLGTVLPFLDAVPKLPPVVANGVISGITQGWAEEKPPTLTPELRVRLAAAAAGATGEVKDAFTRLGTRWGMADLFGAP